MSDGLSFTNPVSSGVVQGKGVAPFTKKQLLSRKKHNELAAYCDALSRCEMRRGSTDQIVLAPGKMVIQISDASSGSGSGTSSTITPYTFISHYATNTDYIVVRPIGGSPTGSDDIIALKPYLLRFSITSRTVGGTTITYSSYSTTNQTRIANNGTTSQTEIITPNYLVGDELQIALRSDGVYIDLNTDGRSFAGPR